MLAAAIAQVVPAAVDAPEPRDLPDTDLGEDPVAADGVDEAVAAPTQETDRG
jgi:hypothetical protein